MKAVSKKNQYTIFFIIYSCTYVFEHDDFKITFDDYSIDKKCYKSLCLVLVLLHVRNKNQHRTLGFRWKLEKSRALHGPVAI